MFGYFGKVGDVDTEADSGCGCDGHSSQPDSVNGNEPDFRLRNPQAGRSSGRSSLSPVHLNKEVPRTGRSAAKKRTEMNNNVRSLDHNENYSRSASSARKYERTPERTPASCHLDENRDDALRTDLISSEDAVIILRIRCANPGEYTRSISVWKGSLRIRLARVGNGHASCAQSPQASSVHKDSVKPLEHVLGKRAISVRKVGIVVAERNFSLSIVFLFFGYILCAGIFYRRQK